MERKREARKENIEECNKTRKGNMAEQQRCHNCRAKGHKEEECWTKINKVKGEEDKKDEKREIQERGKGEHQQKYQKGEKFWLNK